MEESGGKKVWGSFFFFFMNKDQFIQGKNELQAETRRTKTIQQAKTS